MTEEKIISFEELGIAPHILRAIDDKHFTEPTSIQAKTIPAILKGKDVIGGSRTGSGKTLAFSCGIIQNSIPGFGIQALILVPTRELAEQVANSFIYFSKYKKMKIVKIYGGVSINPQMDDLPKADVVVGTPGRILDHMSRETIDFSKVKTLVLDEADMMFDMGFLPDVERIISAIPKKRQTLLFSATVTDEIFHLTKKHMNDAIKVSVAERVDPSKLSQVYYDVPSNKKFPLLVHLLQKEKEGLVMVFCNTRRNADFVGRNLKLNDIPCQVIHGGLTQARRGSIMADFHKGNVYALVCTDVAARGLDIPGVSHVYNYDTCNDPNQYIHRIGRTARAGKDGKAITLLSERDHGNFSSVLHFNDVVVKKVDLPQIERVKMNTQPVRRQNTGGHRFSGRRKTHYHARRR